MGLFLYIKNHPVKRRGGKNGRYIFINMPKSLSGLRQRHRGRAGGAGAVESAKEKAAADGVFRIALLVPRQGFALV